MGKYKLIIYPTAKQDLLDIVEYVNTLSGEAAKNLFDEIINKIGTLVDMPERCPLLKSTELRAKGYRTLKVENYMVFFVVKENVVQIRRILYGPRRYDFLL